MAKVVRQPAANQQIELTSDEEKRVESVARQLEQAAHRRAADLAGFATPPPIAISGWPIYAEEARMVIAAERVRREFGALRVRRVVTEMLNEKLGDGWRGGRGALADRPSR